MDQAKEENIKIPLIFAFVFLTIVFTVVVYFLNKDTDNTILSHKQQAESFLSGTWNKPYKIDTTFNSRQYVRFYSEGKQYDIDMDNGRKIIMYP